MDEEKAAQLTDNELVSLSLENQGNFVVLVRRYHLKLFRYLKRISGFRDEDIEDLLQEVFLKTYLNLNDFDGDYKFSSWIYAIARNQAISAHRRQSVRPEGNAFSIDEEDAKSLVSGTDLLEEANSAQVKEVVVASLQNLDSKYRDVLVLKYLEGYDYREISDIIKRPVGTVGSLINQAKKLLKQEIVSNNKQLDI
jgi:RNA polymerase sigma-70 factor, ECF subfamily